VISRMGAKSKAKAEPDATLTQLSQLGP
jgi:hypothetical protein